MNTVNKPHIDIQHDPKRVRKPDHKLFYILYSCWIEAIGMQIKIVNITSRMVSMLSGKNQLKKI